MACQRTTNVLNILQEYLPRTNCIYMLQLARPNPCNIYMDSCTTGVRGVYHYECYHGVLTVSLCGEQSVCVWRDPTVLGDGSHVFGASIGNINQQGL